MLGCLACWVVPSAAWNWAVSPSWILCISARKEALMKRVLIALTMALVPLWAYHVTFAAGFQS